MRRLSPSYFAPGDMLLNGTPTPMTNPDHTYITAAANEHESKFAPPTAIMDRWSPGTLGQLDGEQRGLFRHRGHRTGPQRALPACHGIAGGEQVAGGGEA